MSNNLVSYVHVIHPDQGDYVAFGPDDEEVPDWALKQMGAHCFVDGAHPLEQASPVRAEGTPPPKSGAGATKDAWAEYAIEKDVEVPSDANRDQIIAALAEAGVPVDQQ